MKHLKFIARTVLVKDNQVDLAVKALNKILTSERVIEQSKRNESYEKPYERRNRLSYQKCMEVYGNEIDRKIRFIVRTNRESAFPWD